METRAKQKPPVQTQLALLKSKHVTPHPTEDKLNKIASFAKDYLLVKKHMEKLAPRYLFGKDVRVLPFNQSIKKMLEDFKADHGESINPEALDFLNRCIGSLDAKKTRRREVVQMINELQDAVTEDYGYDSLRAGDLHRAQRALAKRNIKSPPQNVGPITPEARINYALDLIELGTTPAVVNKGLSVFIDSMCSGGLNYEGKGNAYNRLIGLSTKSLQIPEALEVLAGHYCRNTASVVSFSEGKSSILKLPRYERELYCFDRMAAIEDMIKQSSSYSAQTLVNGVKQTHQDTLNKIKEDLPTLTFYLEQAYRSMESIPFSVNANSDLNNFKSAIRKDLKAAITEQAKAGLSAEGFTRNITNILTLDYKDERASAPWLFKWWAQALDASPLNDEAKKKISGFALKKVAFAKIRSTAALRDAVNIFKHIQDNTT